MNKNLQKFYKGLGTQLSDRVLPSMCKGQVQSPALQKPEGHMSLKKPQCQTISNPPHNCKQHWPQNHGNPSALTSRVLGIQECILYHAQFTAFYEGFVPTSMDSEPRPNHPGRAGNPKGVDLLRERDRGDLVRTLQKLTEEF